MNFDGRIWAPTTVYAETLRAVEAGQANFIMIDGRYSVAYGGNPP